MSSPVPAPARRRADHSRRGELEGDERIARSALVRRGRQLHACEVRIIERQGVHCPLAARRRDSHLETLPREERLVQRRDARRRHLNLERAAARAVRRDLAERAQPDAGRSGLGARRRRNRAVYTPGERHCSAIGGRRRPGSSCEQRGQGKRQRRQAAPSDQCHVANRVAVQFLTSSTRRFCWRPSGVSFDAAGFVDPSPLLARRAAST